MKRLHGVIDKFGHSLYDQTRLTATNRHVDVNNKRLRFVADPEEPHNAVTKAYLDRLGYINRAEYDNLNKRLVELESYIDEDGSINGEAKRIQNLAPGQSLTNVSTVEQTCQYDININNFRWGTHTFNIVQDSTRKPFIYAGESYGFTVLKEYGNEQDVVAYNSLFWFPGLFELLDSTGNEIIWDEARKSFGYNSSKWPRSVEPAKTNDEYLLKLSVIDKIVGTQ